MNIPSPNTLPYTATTIDSTGRQNCVTQQDGNVECQECQQFGTAAVSKKYSAVPPQASTLPLPIAAVIAVTLG
jgi:hypothetical protein